MLRIAIACLLIAALAGVFGFNLVGVSYFEGGALGVAQILFFVFVVLAVVAFLIASFRSAPPI